jgi:hypothetical protein
MGGGIFSEEELPHMLRKTYGSLPGSRRCPLPGPLRAVDRIEEHPGDPGFSGGDVQPRPAGRGHDELLEESLDDVPTFAKALQEFSARHLLETIAEGVLQLAMGESRDFRSARW